MFGLVCGFCAGFDLLMLRVLAVVVFTAWAAYTDFRTGYIYNKITYPAILLGLLVSFYEYFGRWEELFVVFGIAALVFATGYLMYYFGKIGGGDVKLYVGIALLLPFLNGVPFVLLSVFGAVYIACIFLSIFYFAKYAHGGVDVKENAAGIVRAVVLGFAFGVYLYMISNYGFIGQDYAVLWVGPVLCALVFVAFERGIRKRFFVEDIKISELEEDEILADEFMDAAVLKKINKGLKAVVGEREKRALLEAGVKEVKVYRNLPRFGLFIFVGVWLALLVPDFFMAMLLLN